MAIQCISVHQSFKLDAIIHLRYNSINAQFVRYFLICSQLSSPVAQCHSHIATKSIGRNAHVCTPHVSLFDL